MLTVPGPVLRPFQQAPGRDTSKDRPPFDIAHAYHQTRDTLAEDAPLLRRLMEAIGAGYDLTPAQWTQWYSVALAFAPDLIVELGRSKGNSTALFCQAAERLGTTRVVSLCASRDWIDHTLPRISPIVSRQWLARLDARITDILDVDYEELLRGAGRVLLLWDAHGFEIAEVVLGRILPQLAARPHLVLMHDISDNRYAAVSRSYDGEPIWKGSTWEKGTGRSKAFVHIGWMTSLQDQIVALNDFATRNDLDIGSADHEYAQYFAAHPERAGEMQQRLGDLFSPAAHWAFLTLEGKQPPFHFPAVQRHFRHRADVRLRDIHPKPRWFARGRSLPYVIRTTATDWEYAAVMGWRSDASIPSGAPRSLRLRLLVDDAPVGVGLLSVDGSAFVDDTRVMPGDHETAYLAVPESNAGALVVHAWDGGKPARVRLEDVSIVW